MKRCLWPGILLLLSGGMAFAGAKEEYIRLQNDIMTVQNQIRMLQKSVDEGGAVSKTLLEQALNQMGNISRTVEQINRRQDEQSRAGDENIEDLINTIRSLASRIDDQNVRIVNLTRSLEATQASLEEMKSRRPKSETGPDGKMLPLPADQLYSLAYNDYIQGNFELAVQGFLDYLANYKDTELADNAQYYIGDCFFNQGRHADAVEAFNQVLSLFPKGDKAPAALLKSGLAHLSLNDNTSAVDSFKNVILKYPDSPEANIAIQQLQILGVEPPARPKKR
jgi:tol-pal system protein YbgF